MWRGGGKGERARSEGKGMGDVADCAALVFRATGIRDIRIDFSSSNVSSRHITLSLPLFGPVGRALPLLGADANFVDIVLACICVQYLLIRRRSTPGETMQAGYITTNPQAVRVHFCDLILGPPPVPVLPCFREDHQ